MVRVDVDSDIGPAARAAAQKDLELGDETDVFPSLVEDRPGEATSERRAPSTDDAPSPEDAEGEPDSGPDPLWMPNFPRKSPPGPRD
jgi:hypothetical protein